MKKYLLTILIVASICIGGSVLAATFNSAQIAPNPINGYVAQTNGSTTTWVATSTLGITGAGTVTSVALTTPTGLSISGSPVTGAGTLALTLTAGYNIPLTASTTQWNNFYNASTTLSYVNNTTDATLTRSGSGPYTLGLNLSNGNTWNAFQQFNSGAGIGSAGILINGGGAGNGTLIYPNTSSNATLTLPSTSGTLLTGNQTITLSGDASGSGATSIPVTFATVNSNVGIFGSATTTPTITVNGKGLITAISTSTIIAPAGTLTGTTLAANVVSSSLTSLGTIATGVWNGTTIAIANGGTGQTTANNALNAFLPTQTSNSGKFLTTDGSNSSWGTPSGSGTVGSGTTGQFPYYATNGTTLTATSTLFVTTGTNIGVGTSTDTARLAVQGIAASNNNLLDLASSSGVSQVSIDKSGNVVINGSYSMPAQMQCTGAVFCQIQSNLTDIDYKVVDGTKSLVFTVGTADVLKVNASGLTVNSANSPSMGTCGTSPSVSGNDNAGRVTVGGGVVTSCTVNYGATKSGTQHVFITVDGVTAIANSVSGSSGTGFTVNFAATLGGGTFDYFVVNN